MQRSTKTRWTIHIGLWSIKQWTVFLSIVLGLCIATSLTRSFFNNKTLPEVDLARTENTQLPVSRPIGDFVGEVVKIIDGDTIVILRNSQRRTVRLNGIDAPELDQPFGIESRRFVRGLVLYENVSVAIQDQDHYERIVADVFLSDGTLLNSRIVKSGLAWWYKQYSSDQLLADLENEARARRVGLWSDLNPVPPWDYRAKSRGADE